MITDRASDGTWGKRRLFDGFAVAAWCIALVGLLAGQFAMAGVALVAAGGAGLGRLTPSGPGPSGRESVLVRR